MPKANTLTDTQIREARKILANLPEKNAAKPIKVAAAMLKADFMKAVSKGYSPKEISDALKTSQINVPVYQVKKQIAKPVVETEKKEEEASHKIERFEDTKTIEGKTKIAETLGEKTEEENAKTEKESELKKVSSLVKHGNFNVIPDTPDGEL